MYSWKKFVLKCLINKTIAWPVPAPGREVCSQFVSMTASTAVASSVGVARALPSGSSTTAAVAAVRPAHSRNRYSRNLAQSPPGSIISHDDALVYVLGGGYAIDSERCGEFRELMNLKINQAIASVKELEDEIKKKRGEIINNLKEIKKKREEIKAVRGIDLSKFPAVTMHAALARHEELQVSTPTNREGEDTDNSGTLIKEEQAMAKKEAGT